MPEGDGIFDCGDNIYFGNLSKGFWAVGTLRLVITKSSCTFGVFKVLESESEAGVLEIGNRFVIDHLTEAGIFRDEVLILKI